MVNHQEKPVALPFIPIISACPLETFCGLMANADPS